MCRHRVQLRRVHHILCTCVSLSSAQSVAQLTRAHLSTADRLHTVSGSTFVCADVHVLARTRIELPIGATLFRDSRS